MYHDDSDTDWDEDDEDDGYVPCSYCGEPMYEEGGYCSACERWITREDIPGKTMAPWMVVIILILLGTLIFSAMMVI